MSIPFLNGLTINRDEIPEYPEFNKKFTERLDKSICNIILQSNNPVFTPEMKSCFRNNVVNHIKNNELKTEWRPIYGIGRYYPKGNISLTPISKYIKCVALPSPTTPTNIGCLCFARLLMPSVGLPF